MIPEKLTVKKYYKIGEVAAAFGETVSTLRHWESEIETLSPIQNGKKNKQYQRADIELIALIKELVRREKLSIAGVNERLKKKKTFDKFDIKNRLLAIKEVLKGIEKNL